MKKKIVKNNNKKRILLGIVIVSTILRFLLSYKLPSFVISNMVYDDALMMSKLFSLIDGKYFGIYNALTLVKGCIYPLVLFIAYKLHISYSIFLTILYILSCIYFTLSLKSITKRKWILVVIYIVLLFNPVSYSIELLQRLYRNSLSIIEILFFLGVIFRILTNKKESVYNYIFLGLIISIMYLTKEENIWVFVILFLVYIYKLYKKHKFKNIMYYLIPLFEIIICLNIVCLINYKYYKIYTYNELNKSEFKKAYTNILKIKDENNKYNVPITKNTLYKLYEKTTVFNLNKKNIDLMYEMGAEENGEIYSGNMVWYFKSFVFAANQFKSGEESERYFYYLNKEIEELFKKGEFKKKFSFFSIFINAPTFNDIKKLPKALLNTIIYTSSYKDIKVINNKNYSNWKYDKKYRIYYFQYYDYHNTAKIVKKSPLLYEILRNIYKYLTIILSIPCLIIYIKNIKKIDKLNILLHVILITYLIIICGVTYTHVVSFDALRYGYLGNIYLLQNMFILLNLVRLYRNKILNVKKEKRDN